MNWVDFQRSPFDPHGLGHLLHSLHTSSRACCSSFEPIWTRKSLYFTYKKRDRIDEKWPQMLSQTFGLLSSSRVQIGSKLQQHALHDVCKAFRRCSSPWGPNGDLWKSTQFIYGHVSGLEHLLNALHTSFRACWWSLEPIRTKWDPGVASTWLRKNVTESTKNDRNC